MRSQSDVVVSLIKAGDLVYVYGSTVSAGIYSMGCRTAYGPILIQGVLVVPSWDEVKLCPPF